MKESPALADLLSAIDALIPRRIGPEAKFRIEHVVLALLKLHRAGRIGRRKLASELGLGEGSVRSLLKRLVSSGLAESSRAGWGLAPSGEELVESLKRFLVGPIRVRAGNLTVSSKDAAVLVRGGERGVTTGLGIRDAAFRAGADGATVLVLRPDAVYFPDGVKCPGDLQKKAREIAKSLKARTGDAIIIGTSKNYVLAELGAISGAINLLRRISSME